MTCLFDKKVHNSMKRRRVTEIVIEGLDMWDKTEVVRNHLATHRKSLDESPFNNQVITVFCDLSIDSLYNQASKLYQVIIVFCDPSIDSLYKQASKLYQVITVFCDPSIDILYKQASKLEYFELLRDEF